LGGAPVPTHPSCNTIGAIEAASSQNHVLVITGASSGIGAASARRAVEAGYRVALAARREDALDVLADELGGPERAIGVRCDVASWDDQQALADAVIERFGRIDAVFANAGLSAQMGLLESSPEQWRTMVLTNVLGSALTIRATLPHLLERGSGHYLLTSSLAARKVVPGSLYGATKAAVSSLAEALRAELRLVRRLPGIRVTLIEAGAVATDMTPAGQLPFEPLAPEDVARAAVSALVEPDNVDVAEVVVRPAGQPI